jgi:glycosyltransferase involved in cell wall biosynthesis
MKHSITVGLPVFNAMPYLPQTMESLLRQTYSDFTILVVDDGSTDDSLEYLQSIRDPRLTVKTQGNRGLTATLNRMLAEVTTPWLVRQDADDIAYPQRLQHTVEQIGKHPDAGMFYSLADYYPSGLKFRTTQGPPELLQQITQSGYLLSICHPSVTLNVQKALEVGGYRFDLHVEDVDLWWRMALKYDIWFIPEVMVGVRHNSASVSSRNFASQVVNSLFVQYLLHSHIAGLVPLPYQSIRDVLSKVVNTRKFLFREQMRMANINCSDHHYAKTAAHLVRAFLASPREFMRRTAYELRRDNVVYMGEVPEIFEKLKPELWGLAVSRNTSSTLLGRWLGSEDMANSDMEMVENR